MNISIDVSNIDRKGTSDSLMIGVRAAHFCMSEVRKYKSKNRLPLNTPIEELTVHYNHDQRIILSVDDVIRGATCADVVKYVVKQSER